MLMDYVDVELPFCLFIWSINWRLPVFIRLCLIMVMC